MALAPDSLGPTLAIGEILVEIVATTPGSGFRETQPLEGPFPSGAPAIFIDQCARIGGASALVGTVGDDDFGQLNTDRLKSDGVDISGIAIDPDLPTGSAFVRYRHDGARDYVFNLWTSAAGRIRRTDAVEAAIAGAGHLHVAGTLLAREDLSELIEYAATVIKGRGGSLSLDPNLRPELMAASGAGALFSRILRRCDLLLPSGDELQAVAGIAGGVAGEEQAISHLFEIGVPEIALKQGAGGATVFRPDHEPTRMPGFQVAEVDPTGAGDCFGGAYVACRRLGAGVGEALTYATAAGARNVTVRGPMQGTGTRAELDAFIARTPRHS